MIHRRAVQSASDQMRPASTFHIALSLWFQIVLYKAKHRLNYASMSERRRLLATSEVFRYI